VHGAFVTAQACAKRMIAAGRPGAIVHVTSQMGHVGAPLRTAYCAAKHAVEGLTKAMAVELAPHGIRVNAVAPTFVETPMTRPFFADPAARRAIERQIPLGRLGVPDEVAEAVLFAAASPLMTGASASTAAGRPGKRAGSLHGVRSPRPAVVRPAAAGVVCVELVDRRTRPSGASGRARPSGARINAAQAPREVAQPAEAVARARPLGRPARRK
jgi:hypothetical protein